MMNAFRTSQMWSKTTSEDWNATVWAAVKATPLDRPATDGIVPRASVAPPFCGRRTKVVVPKFCAFASVNVPGAMDPAWIRVAPVVNGADGVRLSTETAVEPEALPVTRSWSALAVCELKSSRSLLPGVPT